MESQQRPPVKYHVKPDGFRGPESRFYDTLKGKEVQIVSRDQGSTQVINGILLFVDRYSLGLRLTDVRDKGRDILVYKQGIWSIGLLHQKTE